MSSSSPLLEEAQRCTRPTVETISLRRVSLRDADVDVDDDDDDCGGEAEEDDAAGSAVDAPDAAVAAAAASIAVAAVTAAAAAVASDDNDDDEHSQSAAVFAADDVNDIFCPLHGEDEKRRKKREFRIFPRGLFNQLISISPKKKTSLLANRMKNPG